MASLRTLSQIVDPNLPHASGHPSSRDSMSTLALHPGTILRRTGRLRDLIKNSYDTCVSTVITTKRIGADVSSGPNMHRTHYTNLPPESPRLSAFLGTSLHFSRGPGSPLSYPLLTIGCNVAWRFGMRLMFTCRGHYAELRNRLIAAVDLNLYTDLGKWYGFPPGIPVSVYPVRNSVPGTLVHSKSYVR